MADIVWRLIDWHKALVTPIGIMVLSMVIAGLVSLGATLGGSLVHDDGFNVVTTGGHHADAPS